MDPRRELVLADIRAGSTQREASERHGVNVSTVATWCKRAKERERESHEGRKAGKAGRAKGKVEGEGGEHREPSPPLRARETDPIGPALGANIRNATRDLAIYVAVSARIARSHAEGRPEENTKPPDMKQVSLAASALTTIAANLADVVAVEERLAPKDANDTTAADLSAKVRASLSRRHARPAAAALKLVDAIASAG